MRTLLSVCLVCVAVVLSSGCRLAKDLLPRTHTTAVAPDGQARAFVRQHLNPDPPDDHLYIARPGEPAQEVMALAPDQDWCRAIVWSPDSRKVGFLINDRQLALYDARGFDLVAMLVLNANDTQEVRAVRRRSTLESATTRSTPRASGASCGTSASAGGAASA